MSASIVQYTFIGNVHDTSEGVKDLNYDGSVNYLEVLFFICLQAQCTIPVSCELKYIFCFRAFFRRGMPKQEQ